MPRDVAVAWPALAVAVAAFALKAGTLAQLGLHPLLQPLGELDTAFYVELARTVASDGLLGIAGPFFVSPLYVYFLAGVFALGGTLETVRLVQTVLGAVAVAFVFLMAHHWFGRVAAWLAAGLAALTGLFTFYEVVILPAALDPFLVALVLACLTAATSKAHAWPLAATGLACCLLVLNRPNALPWVVVLALWPAVGWWRMQPRNIARRPLAHLFVLPAAFLIVVGLNACRNYAASGEWILISSHGGLNFYIGNGPEADGTYVRLPGISPSIAGQAVDAKAVADAEARRSLSATEVSNHFYRRSWEWMSANPGTAGRLWARKVALVLNRVNVPLNFSYAYYRQESWWLGLLAAGPWLLLPLGLVGLVLKAARRHTAGFWMWASFVPVYGLSVVAFFVSSRYRMPLLVPLCAAAGGALAWGWSHLRSGQITRLVVPACSVAGLVVIVNWPLGVDDGRAFEQTRQAVWYVEQGRFDGARDYVNRIGPIHAQRGLLHYRVGRALAGAGRFTEAIDQFRQALMMDPWTLETRLELGQALVVTGRAGEAVPHLAAAVDGGIRVEVAAPWLVRALAAGGGGQRAVNLLATWPETIAEPRDATALDLGIMALELGAPVVAERWLRLAVSRQPASAEAHEHVGVALLLQDRVRESIAFFETARKLNARSASARQNLAAAYARAGRTMEARAEAEEALRLDPAERRAAALLQALAGR